jgi:hypothetical protein
MLVAVVAGFMVETEPLVELAVVVRLVVLVLVMLVKLELQILAVAAGVLHI